MLMIIVLINMNDATVVVLYIYHCIVCYVLNIISGNLSEPKSKFAKYRIVTNIPCIIPMGLILNFAGWFNKNYFKIKFSVFV